MLQPPVFHPGYALEALYDRRVRATGRQGRPLMTPPLTCPTTPHPNRLVFHLSDVRVKQSTWPRYCAASSSAAAAGCTAAAAAAPLPHHSLVLQASAVRLCLAGARVRRQRHGKQRKCGGLPPALLPPSWRSPAWPQKLASARYFQHQSTPGMRCGRPVEVLRMSQHGRMHGEGQHGAPGGGANREPWRRGAPIRGSTVRGTHLGVSHDSQPFWRKSLAPSRTPPTPGAPSDARGA